MRLLRGWTSATVLPSGEAVCAAAQRPLPSSTASPSATRPAVPRLCAFIGTPPPLPIRGGGIRQRGGACQGGVAGAAGREVITRHGFLRHRPDRFLAEPS